MYEYKMYCHSILLVICLMFSWEAAHAQPEVVKIRVNPKIVISRIAPGFMGLGYEASAVAQSDYFGSKNTTLINLYKNLSPHGLIRIGGNISDHTQYKKDAASEVHTEKKTTIINHTSLAHLAAFARATGWKVMWGLNLGTGTKQQAVEEADAVKAALGNRLQSFQIGNEVDLQHLYNKKFPSFNAYYSDFLSYKKAIRKVLPGAPFSGPDVAGNLKWVNAFAQKQGKDIKLLTSHYYRTGAHNPKATIFTLLQNDKGWNQRLKQLKQISKEYGKPFRINEVNSFSGGGKEGVSDTFASALWCLNYMFELASYGCNGVNIETDINQHAWISHYAPIVHDSSGRCSVRPEYYGMLAFALAGKGDLIKTTIVKNNINLTAYSTRVNNKIIWITIVNKDLSRDAEVKITLPEGYKDAMTYRLIAPSVTSKNKVTFAGAKVSADGKWKPKTREMVAVKEDKAGLLVPHASAVLMRIWKN